MRDVGTETTTVSVGELSHSVTKVIDLSEIPEGSKSEKLFDPNLFELATIILSDCGISENNQPLYDRVLSRLINARLPIIAPTEQQILTATEKAGLWPNTVRTWLPAFHRYHAELAAMSYNQVGNSTILEQAIELLKKAELEIDRHICPHDSTHRGGAIWEICDDCGAKWADDRGGKPEFKPNEVSEAIREFIKAHSNGSLNNAEPCTNSDVWNCKYCHKTNTCKAINDPRNFGGTENATIMPPTKNEPIQVTPTSKNEYGLDVSYFSDKLLSILRNIGNYKPDEMYRQLNSLVSVVAPVQPTEPEFDYTDVRLTELIMSDCGVSTVNSQSLVERIASRISAGFTDGNTCFGRSETLNLDSRKDIDTAMLKSSVAVTPTELAIFPTGDEIHALADGNTGMLLDDNFIDKLNTLAKQLKEGKYQQDEIESLHSVYQGMLKESQANIDALQSELAKVKETRNYNASIAAIEYAVTNWDLEFLHAWLHGNFDAIRKEWANVPETVFIGADPLHPKTKGETK